MPIVLRQDVQLARLTGRIEHGVVRARQLTNGLPEDALFWRPPEGGWGIAHFLEHATATGKPYLKRIPPVIRKAHLRHRFADNGKWKLSLAGGILRWNASSASGAGSSPRFTRMPMPGPDVLTRFYRTQVNIVKMLRSADGLSLGSIYCWMGGAAIWRLADCFTLLVARTERDLAGVKRVREHDEFPIALPVRRDTQE